MTKCKITVIKTMLLEDLAEEYCQSEVGVCPCFKVGQEFVTGFEKPEGFCDWAWNDMLRFVTVFLAGGNFSSGIFDGWMKDEGTMITCCTDAIRPVIFRLERVEEG